VLPYYKGGPKITYYEWSYLFIMQLLMLFKIKFRTEPYKRRFGIIFKRRWMPFYIKNYIDLKYEFFVELMEYKRVEILQNFFLSVIANNLLITPDELIQQGLIDDHEAKILQKDVWDLPIKFKRALKGEFLFFFKAFFASKLKTKSIDRFANFSDNFKFEYSPPFLNQKFNQFFYNLNELDFFNKKDIEGFRTKRDSVTKSFFGFHLNKYSFFNSKMTTELLNTFFKKITTLNFENDKFNFDDSTLLNKFDLKNAISKEDIIDYSFFFKENWVDYSARALHLSYANYATKYNLSIRKFYVSFDKAKLDENYIKLAFKDTSNVENSFKKILMMYKTLYLLDFHYKKANQNNITALAESLKYKNPLLSTKRGLDHLSWFPVNWVWFRLLQIYLFEFLFKSIMYFSAFINDEPTSISEVEGHESLQHIEGTFGFAEIVEEPEIVSRRTSKYKENIKDSIEIKRKSKIKTNAIAIPEKQKPHLRSKFSYVRKYYWSTDKFSRYWWLNYNYYSDLKKFDYAIVDDFFDMDWMSDLDLAIESDEDAIHFIGLDDDSSYNEADRQYDDFDDDPSHLDYSGFGWLPGPVLLEVFGTYIAHADWDYDVPSHLSDIDNTFVLHETEDLYRYYYNEFFFPTITVPFQLLFDSQSAENIFFKLALTCFYPKQALNLVTSNFYEIDELFKYDNNHFDAFSSLTENSIDVLGYAPTSFYTDGPLIAWDSFFGDLSPDAGFDGDDDDDDVSHADEVVDDFGLPNTYLYHAPLDWFSNRTFYDYHADSYALFMDPYLSGISSSTIYDPQDEYDWVNEDLELSSKDLLNEDILHVLDEMRLVFTDTELPGYRNEVTRWRQLNKYRIRDATFAFDIRNTHYDKSGFYIPRYRVYAAWSKRNNIEHLRKLYALLLTYRKEKEASFDTYSTNLMEEFLFIKNLLKNTNIDDSTLAFDSTPFDVVNEPKAFEYDDNFFQQEATYDIKKQDNAFERKLEDYSMEEWSVSRSAAYYHGAAAETAQERKDKVDMNSPEYLAESDLKEFQARFYSDPSEVNFDQIKKTDNFRFRTASFQREINPILKEWDFLQARYEPAFAARLSRYCIHLEKNSIFWKNKLDFYNKVFESKLWDDKYVRYSKYLDKHKPNWRF